MVGDLRLSPGRGGNRHPLSPRQFILDHLTAVGEDYISNMHRAFKDALGQLGADRDRRRPYHTPSYYSFKIYVGQLAREGLIEPSGREEVPDAVQFTTSGYGWLRRYYRLKAL